MSYPTPPGGGSPYGQSPPQNGWQQQGQGASPVPPIPIAPPGMTSAAVPAQWGPPQQGAYYPPGGPVPGAPVPPSGGGRTVRRVFGGLLAAFGVLGMLGGGALAAHAWSNHQLQVPNSQAYGPVLWRNETVENLFPATVGDAPGYDKVSDKKAAQWNRMGISPDTSCSEGLSGATKEKAEKLGCKAVLRATYVDLSGEMVATVAIIVLDQGTGAQEMGEYLHDQESEDAPDAAVMPLKVPGTLAAKWQANRRNGMGGAGLGDNFPYAIAVTTGAVDGRTTGNLPGEYGKYDGNGEDKMPWMSEADALSKIFYTNLEDLES